MEKNRLEAFSDGVFAIIITIMVLELKAPRGTNLQALLSVKNALGSYALSFIFVAIYWNNHHHMMHTVSRVNGAMLWANMHLLFWLSLTPFVTEWIGLTRFAQVPVAAYGGVLLLAGVAYYILSRAIIRHQGVNSKLKEAVGADIKGKLSIVLYAIAIVSCLWSAWIAMGIYAFVAAVWFIPDRRIEKQEA
jgi:uncharacterized membrane protein